jgi:hypothetical protein
VGEWREPTLTGLSTNEIYFPPDRDLVAVFDGASTVILEIDQRIQLDALRDCAGHGRDPRPRRKPAAVRQAVGIRVLLHLQGSRSRVRIERLYGILDADARVDGRRGTPDPEFDRCASGRDCRLRAQQDQRGNDPPQSLVVRDARRRAFDGHDHLNELDDERRIPNDHDLPTASSFGVVWKNRWWARDATTTNRIKFTQLFMPQAWPALFYIDIPFERGDAIQALVPLGDALLVFGTTKCS